MNRRTNRHSEMPPRDGSRGDPLYSAANSIPQLITSAGWSRMIGPADWPSGPVASASACAAPRIITHRGRRAAARRRSPGRRSGCAAHCETSGCGRSPGRVDGGEPAELTLGQVGQFSIGEHTHRAYPPLAVVAGQQSRRYPHLPCTKASATRPRQDLASGSRQPYVAKVNIFCAAMRAPIGSSWPSQSSNAGPCLGR
jgi:hypothetical protein